MPRCQKPLRVGAEPPFPAGLGQLIASFHTVTSFFMPLSCCQIACIWRLQTDIPYIRLYYTGKYTFRQWGIIGGEADSFHDGQSENPLSGKDFFLFSAGGTGRFLPFYPYITVFFSVFRPFSVCYTGLEGGAPYWPSEKEKKHGTTDTPCPPAHVSAGGALL
jgi:hypothetical protein